MGHLITLADTKFLSDMKDTFIALDHSLTGEINYSEFKSALKNEEEEVVKTIFNNQDFDKNGSISWGAWMCAMVFINKLKLKHMQNLYEFLNNK